MQFFKFGPSHPKEKKTVVLLGDFNADLLKYDHDDEVADFLDAMYSKLLLPNISSPTRITSTSATLIDNILQTTMITHSRLETQ